MAEPCAMKWTENDFYGESLCHKNSFGMVKMNASLEWSSWDQHQLGKP